MSHHLMNKGILPKKKKGEPFFLLLLDNLRFDQWKVIQKEIRQKPADQTTGQGLKNRKEIAAYATMVKSIDDNVKRLLDHLDEAGLRENTVVIFTSDNGFNGLQSANRRVRGAKGSVYDGGLRVPALINWSGTVNSRTVVTPVCGLDLFPTFLEVAGISDYKGTLDGDSLMPLIRGKELQERAIFWHLASTYKNKPCSIIRKGNWKLIQFLKDGKIELYHTVVDLAEEDNLAKRKPKIARELLEELVAWRRANQVPLPPSSTLKN